MKSIKISSVDIFPLSRTGRHSCHTKAKLKEGEIVHITRKKDTYFVDIDPAHLICKVLSKSEIADSYRFILLEAYDKKGKKILYNKDCTFFKGCDSNFDETEIYACLTTFN